MNNNKIIVGRRELVSFSELGIENVVSKIDTGAYSGCIHAVNISEINNGTESVLQFSILDETHPEFKNKMLVSRTYRVKKVRSANGIVGNRYVIKTKISIAGMELDVEIGLSNRKTMKNPVLIGRKILADNFLVDVSGEFLASKNN